MMSYLHIPALLFVTAGFSMIAGMISVPWLDFTELVLAPKLGVDPELTWALTSTLTVTGLILLGIYFEALAERRKFREMF